MTLLIYNLFSIREVFAADHFSAYPSLLLYPPFPGMTGYPLSMSGAPDVPIPSLQRGECFQFTEFPLRLHIPYLRSLYKPGPVDLVL